MFPVGGFVYICERVSGESLVPVVPEQGPYKVLGYIKLPFNIYYELEGTDIHYRYSELKAATKEDELYDKLTQHLELPHE